jgi:hypothetical protein
VTVEIGREREDTNSTVQFAVRGASPITVGRSILRSHRGLEFTPTLVTAVWRWWTDQGWVLDSVILRGPTAGSGIGSFEVQGRGRGWDGQVPLGIINEVTGEPPCYRAQ